MNLCPSVDFPLCNQSVGTEAEAVLRIAHSPMKAHRAESQMCIFHRAPPSIDTSWHDDYFGTATRRLGHTGLRRCRFIDENIFLLRLVSQNLRVPIRPEERAFVGEMLTSVIHDVSVFDLAPRLGKLP